MAAAAPKCFGEHPLDQHQRTATQSGSHPDTKHVNPQTWDGLLIEILAFYKQKRLNSSSLQTKYLCKKGSILGVSTKKCTEARNSISVTACDNNQSWTPKAREQQLYQLIPLSGQTSRGEDSLQHSSTEISYYFCGFSTSTDFRCQQKEQVKAGNYLQHEIPVQ